MVSNPPESVSNAKTKKKLKGYLTLDALNKSDNMDAFIGTLIDMSTRDASDAVYEYCMKKRVYMMHIDSFTVGEKSVIKEYTNKKGVKHMAHHTDRGKYLAPVTKLGAVPIYFQGNFLITPKHFYLKSNFRDCATINDMFVPRNAIPAGQKILILRK